MRGIEIAWETGSQTIPLSEIHPAPESKKWLSQTHVAKYREMLREGKNGGQIQVYHHKGAYHIWDGHHRYEAHRQEGRTHIRAYVSPSLSTASARKTMIFTGTKFVEQASEETARGAYVAWLLSHRSAHDIHAWAKLLGVANLVDPEEMHCTIIYDPIHPLDFSLHGDRPLPNPIELSHYNRPNTRILGAAGSDGALVTTYDSGQMSERHRFFRDNFGLEPTFPTYIPHLTLSYDAHSQSPRVLKLLTECPCRLPISLDRERVSHSL
jgi:hypothetical protein